MSVDPHRLLVLRALRRTGSIQAAAAALHLTASGVSQHLTRLESETGLSLLDRTRRGGGRAAQLTTAGLALAERADGVAAALAEAQREADRLRDGSGGTVRVGGFATALGRLVVPTLARLAISDPALQAQVFEVAADDGMSRLRGGHLDLLVSERLSDAAPAVPGLVEHDLYRDHFRIVVPDIWATPRTVDEILAGPWVTAPPGQMSRRILDQLCVRYEVTTAQRHVCTESRTMLSLVAAGLGAAIVPDLTLSYLSTAGVAVYGTALELGSRVLTVLGPDHDQPSPAADRFRTLLLETAGGGT